jgi:hypothetical protein
MGYGVRYSFITADRRRVIWQRFPAMLIMLLLIPVGTVFGILRLIWLNRARPLLKQV